MQAWLQGMGMGIGMGGPGHIGQYDHSFVVYGAVFLPNATQARIDEVNYGGKILLPSSALDMLLRLNIQYPMMFKLTNTSVQKVTHCGVLEFSAPEGQAILPHWMMQQLMLEDGDTVRIESATLPKATFAKLKPMSMEFLNISNPKAVLEVELRRYACLTKNDRIPTSYAGQSLEFLVVDVKPANSVCIIECDVNLDFDAPEGYVEPKQASGAINAKPPAPPASAFLGAGQSAGGNGAAATTTIFGGAGRRLDGKKKPTSSASISSAAGASTSSAAEVTNDLPAIPPIVCNEDYKPGRVSFVRYDYKRVDVLEKELRELEAKKKSLPSNVFQGGNRTLRGAR